MSLEVDGYKHDLFEVPSGITGTSLRLQLTGAGVQIYNLFVLELGLEINANGGFSRIHPVEVDRTGRGASVFREAVCGTWSRSARRGINGNTIWCY